jgi:thiol:disulfide interchange protein
MSLKSVVYASLLVLAAAATQTAPAQQTPLQNRLANLLSASGEAQLLDPDQAFKFHVAAKDSGSLVAELIPANGYYLYKDKIRFALRDANGIAIKTVKLPAGEMKVDQTFGKTEVYKQSVPVELALERNGDAKTLTLAASYQGCNEKMGVCYPPIEKTVKLVLP